MKAADREGGLFLSWGTQVQWSSTLSLGIPDLSEASGTAVGEEEEEGVRVEVVPLDIYVLKDHTHFHKHFAVALEDHRIVRDLLSTMVSMLHNNI